MELIEELKEKTEETVEETPAADLVMSLLLMGLSAIICYASWHWPRPEGIPSAPGLFPFLIAASLFLMALGLLVNAVRLRGHRELIRSLGPAALREAWTQGNLKLALLALATVLTYLVVILNLLPFAIGTFLYMAGSLFLFWRGSPWKILVVSACMVAFYWFSFEVLFKLVLPGAGM